MERGKEIMPLREANLDEFSDSDIECLDAMIAMYGNVPFWKRKQDSHDDAWRSAWENRGNSSRSLMPVESIIELVEDSEELLEYLTTRYDDLVRQ